MRVVPSAEWAEIALQHMEKGQTKEFMALASLIVTIYPKLKEQNEVLQKRNSELVEENRRLGSKLNDFINRNHINLDACGQEDSE